MSHTADHYDEGGLGLALQDAGGRAYNEVAFRYFLAIERLRADRSNRPFSVVLVRPRSGGRTLIRRHAAGLFASLAQAVRDTDFIGWYREGHVAAAVLTERADAPRSGVSERMAARVRSLLHERLPSSAVAALGVRVVHVRPRVAERRKKSE